MKKILEIRDLKMTYENGVTALKGVDLDIREGEFVVMIGSSGAGKSTLLRSINRLVDPTGGEIKFEDRVIGKELPLLEARKKIGMIFQHYNLVPRTSVLNNVLNGRLGYVGNIKGMFNLHPEEDKLKAFEILESVGLEGFEYNKARDLSGGQKQRVGIARALAQDPKLMLADEPIASLDPKTSETVMEMLYRSSIERNIPCLVNLHQVAFAKKYATRIVALKMGELVFDGQPDELTDEMIEFIYGDKISEAAKAG